MLKARPRFPRPFSLTTACLAFAAALSNPAAGQGIEANPANWYFTPHLVENHNPPLCQALERAVVGRFFTSKELDNLEDEPALNGPDIDWVIKRKEYEYQSAPSEEVGYDFDVFTLVSKEGEQVHLTLYWHTERHWGNYYGLALIDHTARLDELVKQVLDGTTEDSDFYLRRQAFHSQLNRYTVDDGDWRPPPVFQYQGDLYILSDSYDIFSVRAWGDPSIPWLDAGKAFPVTLTRLRIDRRLEKTCEVRMHAPRAQRERIAHEMNAPRYFAALRLMMGLDQVCPGTANIDARHMNDTTTLRADALLRPWAFEGVDRYLRPEVIKAYLEQWAGESLWNHLHYQEFLASQAEFRQGLSTVFADRLGLTAAEAEGKADWVIESLDHGHFRFSSNTGHWLNIDDYGRVPVEKRLARAARDPIRARRTLNLALLAGIDWATIEGYLKTGGATTRLASQRLLTHPMEEHPWVPAESPVVFALLHPELIVQLHDIGLSIDAPNVFGKTPLMYAAQFDLVDTAGLLLDLGADPKAVTIESPRCTTAIGIHGRSALMYAAENADEEMIKLLLQKGADPQARDTIGRGLEDYLRLNHKLGAKQRRKLADLGQALAPE
jgi:hypothetical protein